MPRLAGGVVESRSCRDFAVEEGQNEHMYIGGVGGCGEREKGPREAGGGRILHDGIVIEI